MSKQKKGDPTFFKFHTTVVLQSHALFPSSTIGTDTYYIPIDLAFWQGKNSFDQYITLKDETWRDSVSILTGWFQPKLLQAEKLWKGHIRSTRATAKFTY